MSTGQPRPDAELIEAIARRVVELLGADAASSSEPRYVDAAALALELKVERDWVYANARKLGAIRLGDGPRGRLRFDREIVAERLAATAERAGGPARQAPRRTKRRSLESLRPKRAGRGGVESTQRQRRAGVLPPARSPKRHQTGGSPE
ncbi:MAG: hypothetical protein JST59_29730 [Actinobacteria bacterium]|nr:hypothetical protein [Actinomycetota bacterium]